MVRGTNPKDPSFNPFLTVPLDPQCPTYSTPTSFPSESDTLEVLSWTPASDFCLQSPSSGRRHWATISSLVTQGARLLF